MINPFPNPKCAEGCTCEKPVKLYAKLWLKVMALVIGAIITLLGISYGAYHLFQYFHLNPKVFLALAIFFIITGFITWVEGDERVHKQQRNCKEHGR